jgi:hypothetical protein
MRNALELDPEVRAFFAHIERRSEPLSYQFGGQEYDDAVIDLAKEEMETPDFQRRFSPLQRALILELVMIRILYMNIDN